LHYSHCHWRQEGSSFPNMVLTSLAMSSTTEGWACGYVLPPLDHDRDQVLLHYTGGQWRRVTIPSSLGVVGSIDLVRTIGPDEVWLVLRIPHEDVPGVISYTGTLVHYHSGSWSIVTPPFSLIGDIAPVAPGELWVTGYSKGEQEGDNQAYNAHLQGGV